MKEIHPVYPLLISESVVWQTLLPDKPIAFSPCKGSGSVNQQIWVLCQCISDLDVLHKQKDREKRDLREVM